MATKAQTEAMNALMRHPGTNKMFREALKSPLGSTARAKAQKTFSIMNKLQSSYDGVGGPGMMQERADQSDQDVGYTPAGSTPQNMVVFHKLPEMKVNFDGSPYPHPKPQDVGAVADGSGGPGGQVMDGSGGIGDWFSGALNTFEHAAASVVAPVATTLYDLSGMANNKTNQSNFDYIVGTPARLIGDAGNAVGSAAKAVGTGVANVAKGAVNEVAAAGKWLGSPHNPLPPTVVGDPATFANYQNQNATNGGALSPQSASIFANNPIPGVTKPSIPSPSGPGNLTTPPIDFSKFALKPAATEFFPTPDGKPIPWNNLANTTPNNVQVAGASSGPGNSNGNTGTASAVPNYARLLGIDPATAATLPFNKAFLDSGGGALAFVNEAIIPNEGGSPNGVVNNPGNIKFVGAPGQINSGVKATDGGTFASYATLDGGKQAIADLVERAASGQSSAYGPNPTLASFIEKYTNTGANSSGNVQVAGASSGPGSSSSNSGLDIGTGEAGVADAVKHSLGKTMFARETMNDPHNIVTGGKSLAQAEADNKASIWKDFNITGLQQEEMGLKEAAMALPPELTDYMRDQDQYLNQTDKMISDFIATNAGKDMSTQERLSYVNHLNSLYTLRGSQNQRYIDYLGSAVAMNKVDIQRVSDEYSAHLQSATEALTSANAITKDTYDTYSQSLQDMYDAVEKAPQTALQNRLIESQIINNQATQASDAAKLKAQQDYLTVYPKMKDQIYDSNGFPLPGIDIVQTLNAFAQSNPEMDSGVLLRIYNKSVQNILAAPSGSKDGNGQVIDKKTAAQAAYTNYAKLANLGVQQKDERLIQNAVGYADEISQAYGSSLGGDWTNQATAVRNLVATLGSKASLFGGGTPSRANFISNAKKISPSLEGMAGALYDQFVAHMKTQGATAQDFVTATLNSTGSQSSYNNQTQQWTPLTDQQLLSHLGVVYANSILDQNLSQYAGLSRNPTTGALTVTSTGSTTSI